jgi:uncharacterized SAM-binding protein YcdF (DUF218 family)
MRIKRWQQCIGVIGVSVALSVFLPSLPMVRTYIAAPLYLSDDQAAGDAAYVLAAGIAFHERLFAAADLYHMKRISMIILMNDVSPSYFQFTTQHSLTRSEWALSYLDWLGVPRDKIMLTEFSEFSHFGTRREARCIAKLLPTEIKQLVIITSAPHTSRSFLTFRRTLEPTVKVIPYAATPIKDSSEFWEPLWIEYFKLAVYWVIA